MDAIEHKIDRTGWSAGSWDNEPDRIEWRHGALPCLIVRNRMGALCGYVGVPGNHPWHGKDYDAIDVSIHGGLTYAHSCQGAICHVAQPGEADKVWWLGFDCAHSGDVCPGYSHNFGYATYKPVEYVRSEVEILATLAEEAA